MVAESISEVIFGVYLGLLASLFPAFIAFAIGFGFRYFTEVTVPAFAVVVLGGALAGVSGGLMGFVDPQLANNWTGITATAVILMASLWAHSQGDKLAAATPRRLTLRSLRESRLSSDLVERIDTFGQLTIKPIGQVKDLEGYPPLPADLRTAIDGGSWKFSADLSRSELEHRLESQLVSDFDLAAVTVSIDAQGRAEIAAAPSPGGLSRRVPPGRRAISVRTLVPTGLGRGDEVTVSGEGISVTGTVVSAQSDVTGESAPEEPQQPEETEAERQQSAGGTTAGGEGRVTIAVEAASIPEVLEIDFARVVVQPRGTNREFEAVALLKDQGLRFREVTLGDESPAVGQTVGEAGFRETYGVAVLAIDRSSERVLAPGPDRRFESGDSLVVVGRPADLETFAEGHQ